MHVIKRKSDDLVYLCSDEKPVFKNGFLVSPVIALDIFESEYSIQEAPKPDVNFFSHTLTYSEAGGWSIADIDRHQELDAAYTADEVRRLIDVRRSEINKQRDEKISAGVMFSGVLFQSDPDSRENVNGAYSRANAAKAKGGGLPGDYRWFHANYDFSYTAADNSEHLMDADTIITMGDAFSDSKMVLIKFAQAVKRQLDLVVNKDDLDQVIQSIQWP